MEGEGEKRFIFGVQQKIEGKEPCNRVRKTYLALCKSVRARQSRCGDEMQRAEGKGSGKGDHQADGVPAPLITLSKKKKKTWLGSNTVKTVSKDTRNKCKQGQVFLFLMHFIILFPKQLSSKPFFSLCK